MPKALYSPIVIADGGNDRWKVSVDGGANYTTFTAAPGVYPTLPDLCRALGVAMDAVFPTYAFRFHPVRNADGVARLRFARTLGSGASVRLQFPQASGGSIAETLGFVSNTTYTLSAGPPQLCDSPNIPPGVLITDGFAADDYRTTEGKTPGAVGITGDVGLYCNGAARLRSIVQTDLRLDEWNRLMQMLGDVAANVRPGAGNVWAFYIDDDWRERVSTPVDWYKALQKYRPVDVGIGYARTWAAPEPQRGAAAITLAEVA